jgi:hypothetical protein
LGITAEGGGLKPPNPNSVDPKGIPARSTVERKPNVLGEVADAAACNPERSVASAHEPEDISVGACGIDPTIPEQAANPPIVEPSGEVPDMTGLTPGVPSSVAPNGIPIGATAAPGPRPSGDVTPSAGIGSVPMPPTWAKAQLQLNRVAAVAIHRGFISFSLVIPAAEAQAASRSGGAMNSGPTGLVIVSRRMRSISVIAAESMRQPMASRTAAS